MRTVPWIFAALVSVSLTAHAQAEGEGLSTDADRVPWPRLSARVLPLGAPSWRADLAPYERTGLKTGSLGVLGDMYFGAGRTRAESGGFRATSGLIVGGGRPLAGSDSALLESATVPYLGVGYSNAWPKSGWRFSADLGLVSLSPSGATGIGKVIGGSQSLDDLVRDMRLAPVVQLGVSYSF